MNILHSISMDELRLLMGDGWGNGIYKPQNFFLSRNKPFVEKLSLPRCIPSADKWIAADLNGNSDYSREISVESNSLFQRENGKLGNNF